MKSRDQQNLESAYNSIRRAILEALFVKSAENADMSSAPVKPGDKFVYKVYDKEVVVTIALVNPIRIQGRTGIDYAVLFTYKDDYGIEDTQMDVWSPGKFKPLNSSVVAAKN